MEIRDDLRQRHIEGWTAALRALKPEDTEAVHRLPLAEFYGVSVRAAIRAGWFGDDADPDDVGDMMPRDVQELSEQVWAAFEEATTVAPNS